MGVLILLGLLVFGNGYQAQKKFDLCKEKNFDSKDCKLQKKMNKYSK